MQAKTVSVGPVTVAVTNQVCASQRPFAGQMVLNGAGGNANATSIFGAAPVGSGSLSLAAGANVFNPVPYYVYITSAGDNSGITFTVTGTDANGNFYSEVLAGTNTLIRVSVNRFTSVTSVTASGASATNVSIGTFSRATFTGGTARQVTITPTGNESSNTFVVTGTDLNGNTFSETVAGLNGTASTTNSYFYTVTSIRIANNAANAIVAGMTATAASNWVRFDDFAPSNISIQCRVNKTVVSDAATYTVQSTLDDPNDPFSPVSEGAMTWVSSSDPAVVGAVSTQQSNFLFAPKFARVVLTTASTGQGSVTATFLQSSNGPK